MRNMQKRSKSISDRLRGDGVKIPQKKEKETLWRGPEVDGITQSMLSRFLVCRERFRLSVCDGLKTEEGFNHKMEYGNMWHVCEEHYAKGESQDVIKLMLLGYCKDLCSKYPTQQEQIDKWYNVCSLQFPLYVGYWSGHKALTQHKPIESMQEKVFDVGYQLPSGRIVRLRGKFDSVHLQRKRLWVQENKTKGDIKEELIRRQLKFDLQTMIYLVALQEEQKQTEEEWRSLPIEGILYNVIRRPLSGGKGTIVQKKGSKNVPPESKSAYYKRLQQVVKDDIGMYFMRWEVPVSSEDIYQFKRRFLNPLLEQLCQWWEWVADCYKCGQSPYEGSEGGYTNYLHWQHPFGVNNVLNEGGSSDLDSYLETGNMVGLRQIDNLFPELS